MLRLRLADCGIHTPISTKQRLVRVAEGVIVHMLIRLWRSIRAGEAEKVCSRGDDFLSALRESRYVGVERDDRSTEADVGANG